MSRNFNRDPSIIRNIAGCIFKQFVNRMKQFLSSKIFRLVLFVAAFTYSGSGLFCQTGDFTIEIRQPVDEIIYTCPGDNLIFLADGQNADDSAFDANEVVFTWNFGYADETKTGNTVSYIYQEGGHYELTLTGISFSGDTALNEPTIHVYVSMRPNFTNTRSDNASFCSGEPITLTGFVQANSWEEEGFSFSHTYDVNDFIWQGPGITSQGYEVAMAEPPLDEGHLPYTFKVMDDFGCFHDTTLLLYGVYAQYVLEPETGEAPLEVTFRVDSSSNGGMETSIDYRWEFFEQSRDTVDPMVSDSDVYSFEQPGVYVTRMIATYDQCSYRFDSDRLIRVDSSLLEIPNVFTPNEDGANDFFQVKAVSLQSFYGQIFNRWGTLVYEWDDWKNPESGWNGKHMGTGGQAPSGTYYYVIRATGWDIVDYEAELNSDNRFKQYRDKLYTGSLTLFR